MLMEMLASIFGFEYPPRPWRVYPEFGALGLDLYVVLVISEELAKKGGEYLLHVKHLFESHETTFTVPFHAKDGQVIVARGQGLPNPEYSKTGRREGIGRTTSDGGSIASGNLLVKINVQHWPYLSYPDFSFCADDLYTQVFIGDSFSSNGGYTELDIEPIGRKARIRIPRKVEDGQVLTLSGLGLHSASHDFRQGDLYVKVTLVPLLLARLSDQVGEEDDPMINVESDRVTHQADATALRDEMCRTFSFDELKSVCFDFGVDHENLDMTNKQAFVQSLILMFQREDRLEQLIETCRKKRPRGRW